MLVQAFFSQSRRPDPLPGPAAVGALPRNMFSAECYSEGRARWLLYRDARRIERIRERSRTRIGLQQW